MVLCFGVNFESHLKMIMRGGLRPLPQNHRGGCPSAARKSSSNETRSENQTEPNSPPDRSRGGPLGCSLGSPVRAPGGSPRVSPGAPPLDPPVRGTSLASMQAPIWANQNPTTTQNQNVYGAKGVWESPMGPVEILECTWGLQKSLEESPKGRNLGKAAETSTTWKGG